MIKFFYELKYEVFHRFDEKDNENIEDIHFIGIFSSKSKAEAAIEECLKYENIDSEKFTIKKRRLEYEFFPKSLFYVYHEYAIHKDNGDIVDYYYCFPPLVSLEKANLFCIHLKKQKKYKFYENRDYSTYSPDGYIIDEVKVDKIYFHGL